MSPRLAWFLASFRPENIKALKMLNAFMIVMDGRFHHNWSWAYRLLVVLWGDPGVSKGAWMGDLTLARGRNVVQMGCELVRCFAGHAGFSIINHAFLRLYVLRQW